MYIGPGAGFVVATSVLTFILGVLASITSLLLWPLRAAWNWLRFRKVYARAHCKKLIFIGFDGLDPRLTEQWMDAGKLPNLARLRKEGGYSRLRTTFPALSPVAWSTFATGVNPAKHNIFDFLNRAHGTYLPELAPVSVTPASSTSKKAVIEGHRKSEPFWCILGKHRIHSTVIRVPVTFPPDRFDGKMLSAMCTPDIQGTQGTFTLFSTRPMEGALEGGTRQPLRRENGVFSGDLQGVPFETTQTTLRIQRKTVKLKKGEYTPWIKLSFSRSLSGIVRFLITETEPEFSLYATPVQIDPEKPAMPISHPRLYSIYLSKLLGIFSTLGLAEDTWACNEGAISETDFLNQAYLIFDERRQMFTNALKQTRKGVLGCVFDTSDRVQHMFFRNLHTTPTIEEMYKRMDDVVGEALKYVDKNTLLLILSDHGFCSFKRGVNLNAWLRDNGYLKLNSDGVDWPRTSVYALGLGGIYLNLEGREPAGIIKPGEQASVLKNELIQKLSGLRDESANDVAIRQVYDSEKIYRGPYLESSPDLIIGYNEGYRAAWGAALGHVSSDVFEPNDKPWSGDHCVDPNLVPGVLFSNRKIDALNPGIEDLAPTSLALFGIHPPAWMDGRPVFTF